MENKKETSQIEKMCLKQCRIFLITAIILISLTGTYPIFASESESPLNTTEEIGFTCNVMLVNVDETSGIGMDGAKFTLEKKVNDSYEIITEQSEILVSQAGVSLGELGVGEYRLTELEASEGYIILDEVIEFQITEENFTFQNELQYTYLTTAEDGSYIITVPNMEGYILRLPSTGGSGTLPYITSGWILMAAALIGGLLIDAKSKTKRKYM